MATREDAGVRENMDPIENVPGGPYFKKKGAKFIR